MKPSTNALREGVKGQRVAPLVDQAASKPKAKKGFIDEDYHGYFIENERVRRFTIYSGVRYVHPQQIVLRKCLTPIGGGQP